MLSGVVPAEPRYVAGLAGDSSYALGDVIQPGTVLDRPVLAWYHPTIDDEPTIPFDYEIVGSAAGLVVVDKPAFLPATGNGRLVRNTVQTRLRVDLSNPAIVPVHRLDRLTCGLLASSTTPQSRSWYQQQFAQHSAKKTYLAELTANPGLSTTWTEISLPMQRVRGARQVQVSETGTMTRTWARSVTDRLVELRPSTGFTHQLRVLCNWLGAPIVGDDTYPVARELELNNFSQSLHLCATSLELREWGSGVAVVWNSPRVADSEFWGYRE